MKRAFMRLVILLGFALLPLLFNNCSQVSFINLSSSEEASEKQPSLQSDNGTGYGGKLAGSYYHYVPGYVCENRNSPLARLEYAPTEANSILSSSKDNQCLSIPTTVPNTEIDAGSLQHKVIGYGERIFESNSAGSSVVPENPVEIWCVDQWSAPTVEILSLYEKTVPRAETQFYYPSVAKRTELNPSRVVNQQTVRLTSKYFDLLVDKSRKGLKAGTLEGTLTVFEGVQKQTLQCRLGGYLDARLWPAKALQYDLLMQFEWSPLEGLFYTVTGNMDAPWAESVLSTYSADGTGRKALVGNSANALGVKRFNFSADRKNLFVQAMLTGDATVQLYSLDPKTPSAPHRLNNLLTDWGQFVTGDIISSPNSDLVYYLDGAQETGPDIEQWLRAVSLSTGAITQISKSLFRADEEIGQFEVSYPLGKVVYSAGFIEHEIWITDMLGGNPRKVDLSSYLGSTYCIEYYVKRAWRWLLKDDRYLVLVASPRNYLYGKSLLLTIDLSTEKVIFHQETPGLLFLSSVPALPLVGVFAEQNPALYLDLNAGLLRTVTETQNALKNSTEVAARRFAASLALMTASDLCPNGEQLISRTRIDENKWLLIKKGATAVASIYLVSNDSENCSLINRSVFPDQLLDGAGPNATSAYILLSLSSGSSNAKAVLSQDQRHVLLTIMGRLYLIPTDGHPVLEVYTPLNSAPSFSEIGFVNNSRVYFTGSVIRDYTNQLFLWDVPQY